MRQRRDEADRRRLAVLERLWLDPDWDPVGGYRREREPAPRDNGAKKKDPVR